MDRAHTKGRERPILFSAPMVRALLDGRKTQTRRILKPQPNMLNGGKPLNDGRGSYSIDGGWKRYPISRGDRLWVRESGQLLREAYDHDPRCGEDVRRDAGFYHSADGEIIEARSYDPPLREWIDDCTRINRPSIHMPRWASRLTLTVTDVRVQRLQDIKGRDIIAEGVRCDGCYDTGHSACRDGGCFAQRIAFENLWDGINGTGSWEQNPWVAAYTFTVERRNIDEGLGHLADATSSNPPSMEGR